MYKGFKKTGAAVLASLFAFSLMIGILPPVRSSAKVITGSVEVALPEPLRFRSSPIILEEGDGVVSYSPSDEDYANQGIYLKSMSQSAVDAFIMDRPLESMWIDFPKTSTAITLNPTGNPTDTSDPSGPWDWVIDMSVSISASPLDIFTDPAGAVAAVNTMLDEWFTPQGATLYDKVKSIHDYVCLITEYNKSADFCYSPYGTLAVGECVCEGYAETFKLLCERNGIECIIVCGAAIVVNNKGKEVEEEHAWNYVRMDDGKWYAVDCTWDDGGKSKLSATYFLVGTDTVINKITKKKFTDDHIVRGDISKSGFKTFDLPTLSKNAYTPGSGNNKSSVGNAKKYYYNQLDTNGKAYYDALLKMSIPSGTPAMKAPETPRAAETREESEPEETEPPVDTVRESESANTRKPKETGTTGNTDLPEDTGSERITADPKDTVGSDTSDPTGTDPGNTDFPEETPALTADLPDTTETIGASDTGSDRDTGKKTDTVGEDTILVTVTGTLPTGSGTSAVNGHEGTDPSSDSGSKTGLLIIGGAALAAVAVTVILIIRKKK